MPDPASHRYVVVLAGGSGSRLWPMSRAHTPKQFLPLFDGESTAQHMLSLVRGVVPEEQILFAVPNAFVSRVHALVPGISKDRIIIEPEARDTGAALCLAAAVLARRDPDAVVAVVNADHIVETQEPLQEALADALTLADNERDYVVFVGTTPKRPHTGLGYIRKGKKVSHPSLSCSAYHVAGFEEKPTSARAAEFLSSGKYLWNTGYKAFHCAAFLGRVEQVAPQVHQACSAIGALPDAPSDPVAVRSFQALEKKSFEYLFGRELPFLVVDAPLAWHDIGDWKAVHTVLKKRGTNTGQTVINLESENAIVVGSKRVVALYGVPDIVVVDTDDALLIVDRNKARNIKGVIDELKKRNFTDYL